MKYRILPGKFLLLLVVSLSLVAAGVLSSCMQPEGALLGVSSGKEQGSILIMSERDTDRDSLRDLVDPDDDNDKETDDVDVDDDDDGIMDADEVDHDGDGTIDDHDDDYAEIKGIVTAVGETTFILFGYTVVTDEDTEYDDISGFAAITIGMCLEVEGTMLDEQRIHACEVEADDDDDGDDTEEDDDNAGYKDRVGGSR